MKTFAHWYALIIGLIALAGSSASVLLDRQQFFVSYLCAYLFWRGDRGRSKNCLYVIGHNKA
jgi:hypothetical protein